MYSTDDAISLREVIADLDLVPIAIFCALGFLLTLSVMLRLPDLAAFLV
jgi:hypothetical protein